MSLTCVPYEYSEAIKTIDNAYINVVLNDNPVAYWPLNLQTPLNDIVSGNDFRIASGTYSLSPVDLYYGSSGCMVLNGSLNLQANYIPTALNTFSMEMWMDNQDTTNNVWLENNENVGWSLQSENATSILINVDNDAQSGITITTIPHNIPTHVVATFQPGQLLTYINGVLTTTYNFNTPVYSSTSYLNLGSRNGTYGGNGRIAGLAFYNYILTAEQIQNHYNAGIV